MSFSAHLPGSSTTSSHQIIETPSPGGYYQRSPYSYVETLSGVTNPVSLQADVIYPNALAAVLQSDDLLADDYHQTEGAEPGARGPRVAVGCVGHSIDGEFPLECKTPFALPLVMYPSLTDGRRHHEADLCAMPVLNWEAYIQELRGCVVAGSKWGNTQFTRNQGNPKKAPATGTGEESASTRSPAPSPAPVGEVNIDIDDNDSAGAGREEPDPGDVKLMDVKAEPILTVNQRTFRKLLMESERTHNVEETPQERYKRLADAKRASKRPPNPNPDPSEEDKLPGTMQYTTMIREWKKLPKLCVAKIKNVPEFRLEGTWNYLFGGSGGACCFMKPGLSTKSLNNLHLYLGKGSRMRAVELERAPAASINFFKVLSVWDENEESLPFNAKCTEGHPYNDLIFQIVPNEKNDLLAVRRGKSVQIYSTEEEAPYLLESVPNIRYGTKEYYSNYRNNYVSDPLLTGVDFDPIFCSRIVTMDENFVVRFCDIGEETTTEEYVLSKNTPYVQSHRPRGYPCFKLNEACGVTFTNNSSDLFYAWGNSVIYRGDRRDPAISRSHLFPLLDVRNDIQMQAISEQNYFHEQDTKINEYVSCIRRSENDPYYYVGTTSKVYLMDQRVPSHPVLKVSHGLQSPLTYMDTFSDDNFETVIASSQRLPETMCMITNKAHTLCVNRPGCKAKNPVLQCYPSHLSNSRHFFDYAAKQDCFSLPSDFDRIKDHHYGWTTGVAVYPMIMPSDPKVPQGIVVATTNNFGDVFCQDWGQKPVPRHLVRDTRDYIFQSYLIEWGKAVMPKVPVTGIKKPSKNKKNPVDCSILLEPAAEQIQKLPRIRDYSFNCFKPHDMQYKSNLKTLTPMPDLLFKLRSYKNAKVKGMLDIWSMKDIRQAVPRSSPNSNVVVENIVIKEEPPEYEESIAHSSLHTIDIDASEQGSYSREQLQLLSNIERDISNAVNPNESESDDENSFMEPMLPEYGTNEGKFEQFKPETHSQPKHDVPEENLEDEWLSTRELHSLMGDGEQVGFDTFSSQPEFITGDVFPSAQYPSSSSQPLPSTSAIRRPPKPKLSTRRKSGFL